MENIEIKNGKWVTPLGDFNCQSFPLDENNKYLITEEELEKLGKHELKWAYDEDNQPILIENNPQAEIDLQNAITEKQEILKWLSDNDWKFNKVFLGEWERDDDRWLSYLEERRIKRARLDYLESLLREGTNNE